MWPFVHIQVGSNTVSSAMAVHLAISAKGTNFTPKSSQQQTRCTSSTVAALMGTLTHRHNGARAKASRT